MVLTLAFTPFMGEARTHNGGYLCSHASYRCRAVVSHTERTQLAKGPLTDERREQGLFLKDRLATVETELAATKQSLDAAGLSLPCDTHPDSPVGDESAAVVVSLHGTKRSFSFSPLDHLALGQHLGMLDFAAAAQISGAGFVLLKNDGVLLEQALVQWALNRAAAAGFSPIAPPDLAYPSLVEACGFNPRSSTTATAATAGGGDGTTHSGGMASQVYSLSNADLALIGTSEIPLAGLHINALMDRDALPATYCAISHCFRREASSGGAKDRGLYRLHQFTKVELFAFVAPAAAVAVTNASTAEPPPPSTGVRNSGSTTTSTTTSAVVGATPPDDNSEAMLSRLLELQISMYSELGLHFRVLDMPTEELGASAYRKYDIEAWMPTRGDRGEGAFGEISSASNCIDYQSRRLNIRCRSLPKNTFTHTLNATACAVPRVMLALLETHQQADGSVWLPPALRPYMGGREFLVPPPPRGRAR